MDEVGRLIRHAGARQTIDSERMEQARVRVATHWEDVVAGQKAGRRPPRLRLVAIAASVVAVVGLATVILQSGTPTPIPSLAHAERVLGEVSVAGQEAGTGAAIVADSVIETGDSGRIAIRMSGGQSLRLDHGSSLVVHTPNRVSLQAGAVYIDTADAASSLPVLVATPMGTARDIGTQFQVRLAGSMLIVGVRDGLVEVTPEGQDKVAVNKGRYFELASSGQAAEREISFDDPSWDWVETVAPMFDIEGASLNDYLRWYANERGMTLNWEDSTSESKAANAVLTGSIEGATLDEGLEIVQRIAPFEYRVDGESLWVKVD